MKSAVKIFRWNEVKNKSDIKIGIFDDRTKATYSDIMNIRRLKKLASLKREFEIIK